MKRILQDEVGQMKAGKDATSPTPDRLKAKLKEIHEASKPKVDAVLTPEQQEKWKKIKEEAAEKVKNQPYWRPLQWPTD